MSKTSTGKIGENAAVLFLKANGFKILERNYRYKKKEIDIIAQKDDDVYFIEVKLRKNSNFGHPSEFVNREKRNNIAFCADNYIKHKNLHTMNLKLGIVSILEDEDSIEFIEDFLK